MAQQGLLNALANFHNQQIQSMYGAPRGTSNSFDILEKRRKAERIRAFGSDLIDVFGSKPEVSPADIMQLVDKHKISPEDAMQTVKMVYESGALEQARKLSGQQVGDTGFTYGQAGELSNSLGTEGARKLVLGEGEKPTLVWMYNPKTGLKAQFPETAVDKMLKQGWLRGQPANNGGSGKQGVKTTDLSYYIPVEDKNGNIVDWRKHTDYGVEERDLNYAMGWIEQNGYRLERPKKAKVTANEKNAPYALAKDLRKLTHYEQEGKLYPRETVPTGDVELFNDKAKKYGYEAVRVKIPYVKRTGWFGADWLAEDVPANVIYVLVKDGASDDEVKKAVLGQLVSAYGYSADEARQVTQQ